MPIANPLMDMWGAGVVLGQVLWLATKADFLSAFATPYDWKQIVFTAKKIAWHQQTQKGAFLKFKYALLIN